MLFKYKDKKPEGASYLKFSFQIKYTEAIGLRGNSRVRIPVKLRFEYSPERGKFVHRPYVALGSGTEKIEVGAEFSSIGNSDYYGWSFRILCEEYRIQFEGVPVLYERNHHIMLRKSASEYFDYLSDSPKSPWVKKSPWIRLP